MGENSCAAPKKITAVKQSMVKIRSVKEKMGANPQYHFQKDHYTSYEISVSDRFPFSSVEGLHERICVLASVVDDCYVIGKEIPGDRFHR